MMTPVNIKAKTAIEYFKKGYYQSNEQGELLGQGAEKLGIKGQIHDFQVYENLVKGLTPDGSKSLNQREVDLEQRKVAVDCTFAAPKSVSLCALVGGDKRLIEAHNRAVEKVLELMEREYSQTRIGTGDNREVVQTGNHIIAKFNHIESRELDPHLHSHCLVMNMTQAPSGEWYSHLNDAIFKKQKLLGMMYQHSLALEAEKLGYEVKWREHGQFEIKGFKEEDLVGFSKRRQQILAKVGPDSSWHEQEKARKKTRRKKEVVSPEELEARWQSEAKILGLEIVKPKPVVEEVKLDLEHPQVNVESNTHGKELKLESRTAQIEPSLFEDAIKHCSEKRVAFTSDDIAEFILGHSRQTVDFSKVKSLIDSSPELIRLEHKNEVRYTTHSAVNRELATIKLMQSGLGMVGSIAHPEMISHHLEQLFLKQEQELNQGQRQAVMMTLTTSDQFVAWQGVAGAGKTYALKEVQALAEAQGYVVKGFAPSAKAARVLGLELKSETQTVAQLLHSKLPKELQLNQIWFVDEAGLLSAKDAHALLQRATAEKARVVLVGDTKQLSAVEAGAPFKSLQRAGIKTAYLNESQRQKHSPKLKTAIDALAEGRVKEGFNLLVANGSIQQVSVESKIDEIVKAYISLTASERLETLLLAGTHKERQILTNALRVALKAEGSLGADVQLTQLKAKNLSEVELGYTSHFAVGDVVMPLREYKRKQLNKGELYEVVGKTTDTLKLKGRDGNELEVGLDFKKAVYEPEEIEIAVGDRLMWKKNNQSLQQVNGEEVLVKAIDGSVVEIEELNGKTRTIDLREAHHLDHARVRTTYSSQGETAGRVLVAADSTIGKESFYVAASRAKKELCFYTTSPKNLLQWAKESKAQENALELVLQQLERQSEQELASVGGKVTASLTANTEQTPVNTPKPELKVSVQSPNIKAISTVSPPIKSTKKHSKPVQVENRPTNQFKKSEQQTDMAAIVRAANRQLPNAPDWLAVGKRVKSFEQGWGEVEAILGSRVIVKLNSGKQAHILEWPDAIKSKRLTPGIEAFWTPSNTGDAPSNIEPGHWKELVEGSAIHPDLAQRNVQSVAGNRVFERLLSTRLEKIGSGQYVTKPAAKLMEAYDQVAEGGWWASSGIDARSLLELKPGERPDYKTWGSFKADNPRVDAEKSQRKGKAEIIKYEHPIGEERQLFLFEVAAHVAERIYNKHGIQPTQAEKQSGFWHVVHKYNLPITITEGAKKTLSSLSQGEITIGLSGVNGGYISRDDQKNRLEQRLLHPELKVFATPGREFRFAFDQDTKLSTIFNVRREMVRTGELLEQAGCTVRVVQWQEDKGLDDLIVNQGPLAYAQAQAKTIPLSGSAQKHYRGEYNRLSKQVRNNQPALTGEAVDIEVYKVARSKGDIQDGARTIAQSDQSRSFRAELPRESARDATLAYIQRLEQQIRQSITKTSEIQQGEISDQPQISSVEQQPFNSLTATAQGLAVGISEATPDEQIEAPESKVTELGKPFGEFQSPTTKPGESLDEAIKQSISLDNLQELEQSHERTNQPIRTFNHRQLQEPDGRGNRTPDGANQEFGADPAGASSSTDRIARELPEAIGGTIELQEAQSLTGPVEELNREPEQRRFSAGGTKGLGRTTQRHYESANEHLEQQQTGQLFNAIREYIELTTINSAPIRQALENLTVQLSEVQRLGTNNPVQELNAAITTYLGQVETPTQVAAQGQASTKQLLEAIANHVEDAAIESGPVVQALQSVSAQLTLLPNPETIKAIQGLETAISKYLQEIEQPSGNPGVEQTARQLLDGIAQSASSLWDIAEHVEQGNIDASGISTALEDLSGKLSQLQTNKITRALEGLNTAISSYKPLTEKTGEATIDQEQTAKHLVEVISDYVEHSSVDSKQVVQAIEKLVTQMNTIPTSEPTKSLKEVEAAISNYTHQIEVNQTHSSRSVTENQNHSQLPQQVFVGKHPSPDKLMPISNEGLAYKPRGGIWTSPYRPQYGSEWAYFVETEGMESKSKQQQWLVQPKPELKILVVDSSETLKSLPHLPPKIPGDDVHPLNYEAIAQEYDALVIKEEVIRSGSVNNEVYTFDIESTIWFGTRGWPFESIQLLESPSQGQETQPLQPSSKDCKTAWGSDRWATSYSRTLN